MARAGRSPYAATALELVEAFAVDKRRCEILWRYFAFRAALQVVGVSKGFHWLDGSFLDLSNTAPKDIDVVHFEAVSEAQARVVRRAWSLLHSHAKTTFLTDYYFVNLVSDPGLLVDNTHYWYGLFSHARKTYAWRGMVRLELSEDLSDALDSLETAPHPNHYAHAARP